MATLTFARPESGLPQVEALFALAAAVEEAAVGETIDVHCPYRAIHGWLSGKWIVPKGLAEEVQALKNLCAAKHVTLRFFHPKGTR